MKEKQYQEAYEKIEVPSEVVKQAIRKGVQRGTTIKHNKKPIWKVASIIAVVFMVALVSVSITFPSFAERLPIVGSIYDFFKEDNQEFVFKEYEDKSTGINVTEESNGVSVTITDAVYDRESITIAYKIKSEKDLGDGAVLSGNLEIEEIANTLNEGSMPPKKIGENEYAGLLIATLVTGQEADQIHVNWKGNTIISFDGDQQMRTSGNWSFEFTLDSLESKTQNFAENNYTSTTDGFSVELTRTTTTPISRDFHFKEQIDRDLDGWIEEEWDIILFDYKVYDDLGKEYDSIGLSSYGDKFDKGHRIRTTVIDEEATSLRIIPIVEIYDRKVNLVKEPFYLKPIHVPLNK
ncbi:DUF4179 domain-containing protein [Ornithinibacillus halophilus]|uniref:DUF4179 domain-containing protein n=1 Tax=Ornithinibacillus halophilus TaxID=930117 RepID=UPI0013563362|nr:DUF4179 domain-containing protein [Ornithinibacillus halophilus]